MKFWKNQTISTVKMLKFTLIFTAIFASVHAGFFLTPSGKLNKTGLIKTGENLLTSVTETIKRYPKKSEYHEDDKFNEIAEKIANQLKGKAVEFKNVFNSSVFNENDPYVGTMPEISISDTVVSGFEETTFTEVKGAYGSFKKHGTFIEATLKLSPIIVDGNITWIDPREKDESNKRKTATFHMPSSFKHYLKFKVLLHTSSRKHGHVHAPHVDPEDPRPTVSADLGCDRYLDTVCGVVYTFLSRAGWIDMPDMFAKQLKHVLETIRLEKS